jgi:hypothetical protein
MLLEQHRLCPGGDGHQPERARHVARQNGIESPNPAAILCANNGRVVISAKPFRLRPGVEQRADFGGGRDGSATAR